MFAVIYMVQINDQLSQTLRQQSHSTTKHTHTHTHTHAHTVNDEHKHTPVGLSYHGV